jgi:glycosyltransferase involved in cell wall biosynthesis
MPVRVGLDSTYGVLSRTGVGRYVRSIRQALERLEGIDTVPLFASERPSAHRPLRLLQGLAREGAWYPRMLERRALRSACSVLHVPQPTMTAARTLPLVMSVPDLLPLAHPELFTRWPRTQLRASLRALRRADRLLTGSEFTRETVIEALGIDAHRVVTAPLGVSERFRPQPDPAWLRDRLEIEGRYVLCVGTMEPRKNLATSLRAFESILAREPDVDLVVVGPPGWRNREFEQLLSRAPGRVHVTGYVAEEELVCLYSGASCFSYPSLGEGFGLPVLEAMACGAPVLTSDRSSLPEVAGDAAVLVDPEDAAAVADGMLRILSSPQLADDLGRRRRERAAGFSWERCAEITSGVYRELAA